MRCFKCHSQSFTIRGLCSECGPSLHAQHDAQMKAVADMDAAFVAKTGKNSLSDWCGFERFMKSPDLPVDLKKAYVEAFADV